MQPTESLEVKLPVDAMKILDGALQSGRYHSTNEVFYTALLDWHQRQQIFMEELRKLCKEGMDSEDAGEFDIEKIIAGAKLKKANRATNIHE